MISLAKNIFGVAVITATSGVTVASTNNADLITPVPLSVSVSDEILSLPNEITFSSNLSPEELSDLKSYLPSYPLNLKHCGKNGFLKINIDNRNEEDESYELNVSAKGIKISCRSAAGMFYALQTLAQLCRNGNEVPLIEISDSPRFPYRGLHLDVSRHFFNTDYIKKQLDMVARYKINRLHWHLTDATGWRIEIESRPRLTDFAAWRDKADYLDWHHGGKFCEKDTQGAYGGYYTKAEIEDVIEYARLRHITVIPEIEMPGHSGEVLAAYPELSCTGEPYTSNEVCIGNEETFHFFEDVLNEVIEIFPSHYIHIGGDEADRRHWRECPKCQKRIKDGGLDGEDGLQSYMIERIERYVNSKGRDIIGWDEILDGGVAPNATVMSWRGEESGITAARQGHNAIMTPEAYCYLDHYQDDPETQPLAFGSPVTIFQCYSFDPAPASLGEEITKHIIGVQGNTWAEYIPTYEHGEYMLYPRIIALAEVGWSQPERKDQESFKHRINREIRYIKSLGYNPFTLSEQVQPLQTIDYQNHQIALSLSSEKDPIDIRYTLDGSEPSTDSSIYTDTFIVSDSLILKARLFDGNKPLGKTLDVRTDYHKAIGKSVAYSPEGGYYLEKEIYKAGGDSALVDGLRGGKTYMDARWQGFCPNDLDVTIDLGDVTEIHRVIANFMQIRTPLVFLPGSVEVWSSIDGKNFNFLGEDFCSEEEADNDVMFRDFGWTGSAVKARYVRYHAKQRHNQFLFTDEIVIQ